MRPRPSRGRPKERAVVSSHHAELCDDSVTMGQLLLNGNLKVGEPISEDLECV
jgi:hypothetical protein